jgi:hypothetical protein
LGFKIDIEITIPNQPEPGPNTLIYPQAMDDVFGHRAARSNMVLLSSPEGALIELQQTVIPEVKKTPNEYLGYGYTGIRELALSVTDIDSWFKKVRGAGFETTTDYVWPCTTIGRTFTFFDQDRNVIQLFEATAGGSSWSTTE